MSSFFFHRYFKHCSKAIIIVRPKLFRFFFVGFWRVRFQGKFKVLTSSRKDVGRGRVLFF